MGKLVEEMVDTYTREALSTVTATHVSLPKRKHDGSLCGPPREEGECCSEDDGGSHYHCGGCGRVSGMQGCMDCHRAGVWA